jgi:CHAD domain-containing protein
MAATTQDGNQAGSGTPDVPDGPEEPRLPADAAGAVVLDYLREHRDRLVQHAELVRQSAPDAVHQMRIAARRLRSVLGSYRRLFPATSAEPLRAELQWIGRVLGQARDADVLHDRLLGLAAEEPADLLLGPVVQLLEEDLLASMRAGREQVLNALGSHRYRLLMQHLDAFLATPQCTADGQGPAPRVLSAVLAKDAKRLRSGVRSARRAPAGNARDVAWHEARKAARRLRYAAEAGAAVGGKRAQKVADRAKEVQDILGEQHDAVASRPLLRRLGAAATGAGVNGFSFGRLHAREEVAARNSEFLFLRRWKRLKPRIRRK